MEALFRLAIALVVICAVIVFIGIVKLIISKGKSKSALRMVVVPIIVLVSLLLIGFGTCMLMSFKN